MALLILPLGTLMDIMSLNAKHSGNAGATQVYIQDPYLQRKNEIRSTQTLDDFHFQYGVNHS